MPGRPGRRRAYVHRRRTSLRCQPISVSGRTKNDGQLRLLSSRLAAARNTRSFSSSRGRPTWRRKTTSSCLSTTISSSLNSRERNRSAATASTRRNSRYSNDTTKQPPPPIPNPEADSTAEAPASDVQTGLRTPRAIGVAFETAARRRDMNSGAPHTTCSACTVFPPPPRPGLSPTRNRVIYGGFAAALAAGLRAKAAPRPRGLHFATSAASGCGAPSRCRRTPIARPSRARAACASHG